MSKTFATLFPQLTLFPVRPILKTAEGLACTCARGVECGSIGKHPDGSIRTGGFSWRELQPGEKERGYDGCGYGLATGRHSGVFVVDLDGENAIRAFEAMGSCPETFVVRRGSERAHVYFTAPGFAVKNSASELGPGIDIRGDGGYVVAPGSPHLSGDAYEVLVDVAPVEAPAWLLEQPCLRKPAEDAAGPIPVPVEPGTPEEAECIAEAIKMLESAPVAVSGQKGHGVLWVVSQRLMRSFELPLETSYALLVAHYNHRCMPPWSERELRHKLEQARDQGRFELRSVVERFNREILSSLRKTAPNDTPANGSRA